MMFGIQPQNHVLLPLLLQLVRMLRLEDIHNVVVASHEIEEMPLLLRSSVARLVELSRKLRALAIGDFQPPRISAVGAFLRELRSSPQVGDLRGRMQAYGLREFHVAVAFARPAAEPFCLLETGRQAESDSYSRES